MLFEHRICLAAPEASGHPFVEPAPVEAVCLLLVIGGRKGPCYSLERSD